MLLGLLIFLISLASLKLYLAQHGWFDGPLSRQVDAFIPMIIIMPIGPLIFFYVKSSLDPAFRLSKKDRIHFYPVLIDLVPQLTAMIFVLGVYTHSFKNDSLPWGHFIDAYNVYSDIPRWISITLYIGMGAKYLSPAKDTQDPAGIQGLDPLTVNQRKAQAKWLRQFIRLFMVFQGIWLIYLIPYVIPRYTDALLNGLDWYPVYVPLAVLIYWLGIKGYMMSYREFPVKKNAVSQARLSTKVVKEIAASLEKAMQTDRLYLNPALTVAILAEHTGLLQKNISAVLNQHLHKSFNEFVNEYRVNAIKERLLQGESKNFTIAGLAYECGFNSLPTFQRAFKTIMGQTPKEFLSKNY